ncbi:MAG: hypothetical protein ACREXM_20685 [Gammaproteobacteria bacterium]
MSYLADSDPDLALGPLRAAACTYRIALGPRAGQKVLSLQTVPTREPPPAPVRCVDEQGFSLHAEVCCAAHQRKKLESQGQGWALLGAPRMQHCPATSPAPPSPTSALLSTVPGRSCSP